MFFVTGVPVEYHALLVDASKPDPGLYVQRILPKEWKAILAAERSSNTDAMMLARTPQPRPEELGPCPCPECKKEREQGL